MASNDVVEVTGKFLPINPLPINPTPKDTIIPNWKFDFKVVPQRPIYKPNSGPPLQPISLIPSHDLKGIILDCFPYPKSMDPDHFLVVYENEPHIQLIVNPKNIRNYVSDHTLEIWEYKRSSEEYNREVEEKQPKIIRQDEKRQIKAMKKAGVSRDVILAFKRKRDGSPDQPRKRGRGRPPKTMADVFMPPLPLPTTPAGGKRGPGRPRKMQPVIPSPTIYYRPRPPPSQVSLSQPSLSQAYLNTPSRLLLESAEADSYSEEEEDDTDLALNRQLNEESNQQSSSTTHSPTPSGASGSGSMAETRYKDTEAHVKSPLKNKPNTNSPHNHRKPAPILPGMNAEAYPYNVSDSDDHSPSKETTPGSSKIRDRHSSIHKHIPTSESDANSRAFRSNQQLNLEPNTKAPMQQMTAAINHSTDMVGFREESDDDDDLTSNYDSHQGDVQSDLNSTLISARTTREDGVRRGKKSARQTLHDRLEDKRT